MPTQSEVLLEAAKKAIDAIVVDPALDDSRKEDALDELEEYIEEQKEMLNSDDDEDDDEEEGDEEDEDDEEDVE
jgi:hypothetical protein